jgi:acetate---CoA ligase (ADP-forming)
MSKRIENLRRLLNPRHIAFIGGNDAEIGARQCYKLFDGEVWGVNPRRETLADVACYKSIEDLPEAPDAVFLATPRSATVDSVRKLSKLGAGGVACFTAGYGELGEKGALDEKRLIEAAGDMALVGPNSYGLINYISRAILWPFGAGSQRCTKGVALIMQSGMISANLTMNDRSVPISYVVSAGNQAVLTIEDYMDVLIDSDSVNAIGLYVEGIKDIARFSSVADKALRAGKPIVLLKAGKSKIGSALTLSHTGSMAGIDESFQTLFDLLGIIRVDSPVTMLETLKFLSVSGVPSGNKIAAFTCSGGDAALLADYSEKIGLDLTPPSVTARITLEALLPDIATVSNPLDYTTPLWGNTEQMPGVFSALMKDNYDAAVVIQDYPPKHIHEDNSPYRNDSQSFIKACQLCGIPGAVCSDLPENLDKESREIIIEGGVSPLQGFDHGLEAIALSCSYGRRRSAILNYENEIAFTPIDVPANTGVTRLINEWQGKQLLQQFDVDVPSGCLIDSRSIIIDPSIQFPVVLKGVSDNLAHKSEVNAVRLGIMSEDELFSSIGEMQRQILSVDSTLDICEFLVEEMIDSVLVELLVGINTDPQFGQTLLIASGGVFVELIGDSVSILLPTTSHDIEHALHQLKVWPLLAGFRGKSAANTTQVVNSILNITRFAASQHRTLLELDVNPLMVTSTRVVAADVMIREIVR